MLRQALRDALKTQVTRYAPDALTDAYGGESLSVWFEGVNVSVEPRQSITHWTDCTAVVVLYAVDGIERLIHHLAQAPLKLSHEENGLKAEGAAKFAGMKEGPIQATMYSELRFTVNGTITG